MMTILFRSVILFSLISSFPCFLLAQNYEAIMLSVPPDSSGFDAHWYGSSASLFGNTVMIGAQKESYDENEADSLKSAGAVYVLQPDPAHKWQHVQKLVAPHRQAGSAFGGDVALQHNRAIIGNSGLIIEAGLPGLTINGVAHIFERNSNGNWLSTAELRGSQRSPNDRYGRVVALDGDRALVSARSLHYQWGGPNEFAYDNGAAHLFEQDSSGQWQEIAKLFVPDTTDENYFGYSLDIEGDHVLVSAPFEDEDENNLNTLYNAGAAYVFQRDSSGQWGLMQKLIPPDRHTDQQWGNEVCINNGQLFIGALNTNATDTTGTSLLGVGSVYVYELGSSGQWELKQQIFASDYAYQDRFGTRLSARDSLLIVSSPRVDGPAGLDVGAVYVFKQDCNGLWQEFQKIMDPIGLPYYEFGAGPVDIDGTSALIFKSLTGVLHYEVCASDHEVVKLVSCDPMEYYGHWLDTTGIYEDLLLDTGWACDSLRATVQFELLPDVDTTVIWQGDSLIATAEGATFQWGQCGSGDLWAGIHLATDSVFVPSYPGFFAVQIQQNGCQTRSACFQYPRPVTMGQEASLASRIHLYPNPNSGQFHLDLSALAQAADLQIYDATGRWLGNQEQVQGEVSLDLRDFGHGPGLYVIQVRVGEAFTALRVVWE